MNNIYGKEEVIGLYTKYETELFEAEGDSDSWGIIAKIINELEPRDKNFDDPSYFYHVKEIWNMAQEYITSTCETV